MAITAKELAERLDLSPTAVSMALNGRPGVSKETRKRILDSAKRYGFDFSKISMKKSKTGSIFVVIYRGRDVVLSNSYTPLTEEMIEGAESACRKEGYRVRIINVYKDREDDDIKKYLCDIKNSDCIGIVLEATELTMETFRQFLDLGLPIVTIDNYFHFAGCSCATLNNEQGAYMAAMYLIKTYSKNPGYLQSTYRIYDFDRRRLGYEQALKECGISVLKTVTHIISPTIEGAYYDMLDIIDSGTPIARSYFAENDFLAVGAIKALKKRGYRIPEDVAVFGFDNAQIAEAVTPELTTIRVPRGYMAKLAAQLLIRQLSNPLENNIKIEVNLDIIKRGSA